MTFTVVLNTDAQHDFYLAQDYYNAEAPHETARFVRDFFTTAKRLTAFPYSSPELRRGARRANLRTFPYQLWYRVRDDTSIVEIIAVLHHRQDPRHLTNRLEPRPLGEQPHKGVAAAQDPAK